MDIGLRTISGDTDILKNIQDHFMIIELQMLPYEFFWTLISAAYIIIFLMTYICEGIVMAELLMFVKNFCSSISPASLMGEAAGH